MFWKFTFVSRHTVTLVSNRKSLHCVAQDVCIEGFLHCRCTSPNIWVNKWNALFLLRFLDVSSVISCYCSLLLLMFTLNTNIWMCGAIVCTHVLWLHLYICLWGCVRAMPTIATRGASLISVKFILCNFCTSRVCVNPWLELHLIFAAMHTRNYLLPRRNPWM